MLTNVTLQLEIPYSLQIFGLRHGLPWVIFKKLFSELIIFLYLITATSNKDISAVIVFTSRHTDHLYFWSTFHLIEITNIQIRGK